MLLIHVLFLGVHPACTINATVASRVTEAAAQYCVQSCRFWDLSGDPGGAVYISGGSGISVIAYINESVFFKCRATTFGGGLCMTSQRLFAFGSCFYACFCAGRGQAISFATGSVDSVDTGHNLVGTAFLLCGVLIGNTTIGQSGGIWRTESGLRSTGANFTSCQVTGVGSAIGTDESWSGQTDAVKANLTYMDVRNCTGTSVFKFFLHSERVSYSNFIDNKPGSGYSTGKVIEANQILLLSYSVFQGSGTSQNSYLSTSVQVTSCWFGGDHAPWDVPVSEDACADVPAATPTGSRTPSRSQTAPMSSMATQSRSPAGTHTPWPTVTQTIPASTPPATGTSEFTVCSYPRRYPLVRFGVFHWFLEEAIWEF
jgi:hypothetical protein